MQARPSPAALRLPPVPPMTDHYDALETRDPESRERAIFEAHIAVCPGCTSYLDQMRQTIGMVGRLTEDHVPPEAKRDLLSAFRNWKKESGLGGSSDQG